MRLPTISGRSPRTPPHPVDPLAAHEAVCLEFEARARSGNVITAAEVPWPTLSIIIKQVLSSSARAAPEWHVPAPGLARSAKILTLFC